MRPGFSPGLYFGAALVLQAKELQLKAKCVERVASEDNRELVQQ
jgi:hypothetical protein